MSKRLGNIYFFLGLIGVVFTSAGIDSASVLNWGDLFHAIAGIFSNPITLLSTTMALVGVVVNPTTPGLRDNEIDEEKPPSYESPTLWG